MKSSEPLNPEAEEWLPRSQLTSPLTPVIIQPPPPPPPPFLPSPLPVIIQPPPPPPFLPTPLIPVIFQPPPPFLPAPLIPVIFQPPPPFLPQLKLFIPPQYSYVIYPQPAQPQSIFTTTSTAAEDEEKVAVSHEQETGESSEGDSGRQSQRRRFFPPRFRKPRATKPPPKHSAAASISSQVPVSRPTPKQAWKRKVTANTTLTDSSDAAPLPSPPSSTLMIKNIPSQLRRDFMLKFLDRCCRKNSLQYDFFYLPIDFSKLGNKGYCFVNMTTPAAAMKLMKTLTRFKWRTICTEDGEPIASNKVCVVTWAKIQGKKNIIERFEKSVFKCDDLDFLPVIFEPPRNGCERSPPAPVTLGRIRRS